MNTFLFYLLNCCAPPKVHVKDGALITQFKPWDAYKYFWSPQTRYKGAETGGSKVEGHSETV